MFDECEVLARELDIFLEFESVGKKNIEVINVETTR